MNTSASKILAERYSQMFTRSANENCSVYILMPPDRSVDVSQNGSKINDERQKSKINEKYYEEKNRK